MFRTLFGIGCYAMSLVNMFSALYNAIGAERFDKAAYFLVFSLLMYVMALENERKIRE